MGVIGIDNLFTPYLSTLYQVISARNDHNINILLPAASQICCRRVAMDVIVSGWI